ncbi:proline racemase [Bordetella genomosp. 8]|uniref:Proline racemase n=2 Tax=Bordetella genomosp. 8 TaxID=1416806 RepID=A0A1W6YHA9_9BORD|nr:proline racemase [Bordetella genomosp. 8]
MRWNRMVSAIGVHAEGEIGRVITGGVPHIPGGTLLEKMHHINTVDDALLRFLLFEPRGAAQMTVNVLLPAVHPDAHIAFIPLQPDGAHALSGSNCMCVATALLETGMVPMREPETRLVLETPSGLIHVAAQCKDGKCQRVSLEMVPSFVEHLDHPVDVPGLGRITVDVAFGGCYFALVDPRQLGLALDRTEARRLVEIGAAIQQAAAAQIAVRHPVFEQVNLIEYALFAGSHPEGFRNCNIIFPGRVDRSPCGTGSAARLAVMHARGLLDVGGQAAMYSLIDSRFDCEIVRTTQVGARAAVVPRISGRAWIYSMEHYGRDPDDPYPDGYVLADTWGPGAARIATPRRP